METCIKSEPESSVLSAETTGSVVNLNLSPDSPSKQKKLAEAIDVLNANPPGTPNVRMIGFYFYHSYEVIAVTVYFSFLVHVSQIIFTNETKVIYMDLYNNYILKHLYWVFLNMLNMLFELWNFSIVVLEWYIILFTLILSTHCYQNAFTMRSYVICTIIFSEKKESSIRTSKYAEEDQTENVILRSLKILLLKFVCIQRPQSFKRNVFHWEHIPVHVLDIAVTMDSYWSLGRLSFIKNASVRVS